MNPDPRTYIPAETSARIGAAIEAITGSYNDHLEFITTLRDLPGTHGIRDIYVASDSITYREHGQAILNLAVIVDTETGVSQEDARSRITSALDDYNTGERRVVYEFTSFEKRPIGALASVRETRNNPSPTSGSDELLDRLRTIHS